MPQVVIVSSLGPQGPVGPQGLQGPSGSFDNISGSFVTTASFSAFTQSVNSFTESINAFTASYNTGSFTGSFTGSANLTSFTASDAFVTGNVTVLGTASINTLIVNQTQLSTGSNQLGDTADDTQTLYGTVRIPTGSLTVSGSTLTSGSLTVDGNIGLTGDIIQQDVNLDMKISGAQTGRAVKLITSSTGLRLQAIGSTTSNFTLSTTVSSSETARVTILEGGNVGIGTVTPSYTLDISGSLRVGTPTATPHLIFARASNNYITTPVGGALLFNLNNTAVENNSIVGIYSTGLRVGTGFANPSAVAHVRGSGTTNATTALLIQNSNASASLTVLDNGYIGVGIAAPLRQLHVVGDIEVTNGIYGDATDHTFYTIASGSFHHRFYTRTSGGTSLERFTIEGGSDTANAYFQNTNVGIGTTAPGAKLEIRATGSNETTQRWLDSAGNLLGDFAEFGDAGVLRLGYVISSLSTNRPLLTLDGGGSNTSAAIYLRSKSGTTNVRIASDLPSYISGSNLAVGFLSPTASAIIHISGAAADNIFRVDTPTTPYTLFVSGSGNIGIGTSTPSTKLDIAGGDITVDTSRGLIFRSTSGYVKYNGSQLFNVSADSYDSNGYFRVRDNTGTNTRFIVLDGGNVGIGTAVPTGSLHIKGGLGGATSLATATGNPILRLDYASNPGLGMYFGAINAGGGAYQYIQAGTSTGTVAYNLTLSPYGGNVGVGTTAPTGGRLHIQGSGATSVTTALRVENSNTSASMVVLDNGYVGIGTVTPSYSLDVYGSYHQYQVQGLLARYDISSANANQNRGVWDFYTNVAVAPDFFGRFGFKFEGGVSDSFKQYQVHIGDSTTPKFIVDGAGRVAIGTITPSASLHISGSSGSVLFEIDSNSSQNILYVSGSGNVGIGTNTPTQKLDVEGNILVRAGNVIYFRDTVSYINEASGLNITSGLTRNIRLNAGGIDRLTVSASGNIGIGTNTPAATLDIQSTTTGSIRISGSAGSQITFVRPTAGLTGFVRYIGTSMDIGTVGSDGLNLYTSNTSRVSIQTNGDVLIGSGATPAGRLEVKGSGTTSSTISLRVGNSTPAPSLVITDDLTSRFYGNVGIGALPASGSLHISGAASTSSAAVYIYKSGSTTLDIQGSQGQLFSVTDALSGSLMSVNDISGLPIMEVFSDDRVVMGSFSQPALLVTGSAVRFPATASTAPAYTGSEGQVVFGVVGGNAFIYAWLGGRWRSGSLA